MSHEPPSRLPELQDGLTVFFKPSLFEVAALSPFHSPTALPLPTTHRHTAVLPLPITRQLLNIYRSPAFLSELLLASALSHADLRLLLAVDESTASSTSCMYGFVILSGPLQRVQRAIDAVIRAVEDSIGFRSPPAAASLFTPLHPPQPPTVPFTQPCLWEILGQFRCVRKRCSLPDSSHDPFVQQLARHLDTSPRPLSAVPAFSNNFSFVVCRALPNSPTFLCSVCVPNTGRVRGYVIGHKARMLHLIEHEIGAAVTCNKGVVDETAKWMTVTAVGDLVTVDTFMEAILLLHDTEKAIYDQVAQQLKQWKQRRAERADRPMMLSLHSRGVQSPQLDSLFAQCPTVPTTSTVSQPPIHSETHCPEQTRTGAGQSASTATSNSIPTEPCPRSLLSSCDDSHCRLSHDSNKPYAAWLAERLCCRHENLKQMPFFVREFKGLLSDSSGLPSQPLLVSLPVPGVLLPRLLRSIVCLQQQLKVHINVPRAEYEPRGSPWAMLRSRGDTRQVDAIIEWSCCLMEHLRLTGLDALRSHSKQEEQAKRLTEHIVQWMARRAEYVAEHGEVLYAFVSRGLEWQERRPFTLPAAVVAKDEPHGAAGNCSTERHASRAPRSHSNRSPSSSRCSTSPSSADSSTSSSSRDSSPSVPASPPSSHSPPSSQSAPISPPLDPVQLLDSMRATGRRLAYTSFVQHPSFSATAQPFIRHLPDQSFGCWPIPTALRETFVWTLDEEALTLSKFEERWGVDVYVPAAGEEQPTAAGGSGSNAGEEWCNVCVRMKLACGEAVEEGEVDNAATKAAEKDVNARMDGVMLSMMRRARRVEQLMALSAR